MTYTLVIFIVSFYGTVTSNTVEFTDLGSCYQAADLLRRHYTEDPVKQYIIKADAVCIERK
jgi:hypothetical protein